MIRTNSHLRTHGDAVLRVEDLRVHFPTADPARPVQAVSDVSFDVVAGETLGLVGESGCGKSSLAKAIVQLPPPTSGRVLIDGQDMVQASGKRLRQMRPRIQMIFQDPIASLNPKRTVREIVAEPAVVWKIARGRELEALVDATLESVGLDPASAKDRRPDQFSGGQCQRICIARALIMDPEVLICDEAVSALDVSIQAQILNLLEEIKERRKLTLMFISHDLAVVKNISDRIAVMYLGKLCEVTSADMLYRRSAHPYTRALVTAIPVANPKVKSRRLSLVGELPSAAEPPSGCRFRTRCPYAQDLCASEEPALRTIGPDHTVACHFPLVDDFLEPMSIS